MILLRNGHYCWGSQAVFGIGYTGQRTRQKPKRHRNLKSAIQHADVVDKKLAKECKLLRVIGPFPTLPELDGAKISPLGAVPKKTAEDYRLIRHMSFPEGESVNDGIPPENSTVHYATIEDATKAIKAIGPAVWLAKVDVEAAFRIMPVCPDDKPLLCFHWRDEYYMDATLSMGCSSSCKLFESFSTALEWIAMKKLGARKVIHVIDDFLFMAATYQKCLQDKGGFEAMCAEIGVPLAPEKACGPATTLDFLGITIDTIKQETRMPLDKINKARYMIEEMLGCTKTRLRNIQSLVGFLNFVCRVITPGRAFLRRLIDLTCDKTKLSYKEWRNRGYIHVRVTVDVKEDLRVWLEFLRSYNGKSFFRDDKLLSGDHLKLHTDAAKTIGFGAIYGANWFSGEWPENWKSHHITLLELYPIVAAVRVWGTDWANRSVCFYSDNIAVVAIINKQSSPDKRIMILVRKLIRVCLKHNIMFGAKFIPGYTNVLSDSLSRLQMTRFRSLAPWANKESSLIPEDIRPSNCGMLPAVS